MTTVCLNMIVKNEAHVIRRCLDSVRPLITTWCILDTGSTDGTQEIIRAHLQDLPGELHEAPWKGFGPSRTEAIQLARGRADYLLFIDADDEMHLPPGFQLPDLAADSYYIPHRQGENAFQRLDLVATRWPWSYRGVLHEFVESDRPRQAEVLAGPWVEERREGARSQDPKKYQKDAKILEQGLRDEPGNARYAFYLGQSWLDAGEPGKALKAYQRRVRMGGWDEEVHVSLLRIARILETLGRPDAEIIEACLKAYQARPQRAEPMVHLAGLFRKRQQFHLAVLFAEVGLVLARPGDLLFVDESCYTWRCLDEFAVAAAGTGRYGDALEACERLLQEGHLPADQVDRVRANRDLVKKALGA